MICGGRATSSLRSTIVYTGDIDRMPRASIRPGGQVFYTGPCGLYASTSAPGLQIDYGMQGHVIGPAQDGSGRVAVSFGRGNDGNVCWANLDLSELSHTAPPALPAGFVLGERIFHTGATHTYENGDRLEQGQQGEVIGPAWPTMRSQGLEVRFDGLPHALISLPLTMVSRKPPRPPTRLAAKGIKNSRDPLPSPARADSFQGGTQKAPQRTPKAARPATPKGVGGSPKLPSRSVEKGVETPPRTPPRVQNEAPESPPKRATLPRHNSSPQTPARLTPRTDARPARLSPRTEARKAELPKQQTRAQEKLQERLAAKGVSGPIAASLAASSPRSACAPASCSRA